MLTKAIPAAHVPTTWDLLARALKRTLTTARIYRDEFADAQAKAAECEDGRHRPAHRADRTVTPSNDRTARSDG